MGSEREKDRRLKDTKEMKDRVVTGLSHPPTPFFCDQVLKGDRMQVTQLPWPLFQVLRD